MMVGCDSGGGGGREKEVRSNPLDLNSYKMDKKEGGNKSALVRRNNNACKEHTCQIPMPPHELPFVSMSVIVMPWQLDIAKPNPLLVSVTRTLFRIPPSMLPRLMPVFRLTVFVLKCKSDRFMKKSSLESGSRAGKSP